MCKKLRSQGTMFRNWILILCFANVGLTTASPVKPANDMQLPEGFQLPEGMKLPEGMQIPEGFQLPEGMKLPEGFQLPEGMKLPEGMQLPDGMKIPDGMKLPDGLKLPDGMKLPAGMSLPSLGGGSGMPGLGSMSSLASMADLGDLLVLLPNNSAFGIQGMPMMLNCSVPPGSAGPVVWTAPGGEEILTHDYTVVSSHSDRLQVLGDQRMGIYNLMFKYVEFPHDNGTWTCKQFAGKEQTTLFFVLSPPVVRVPDVTPVNANVIDMHNPWTFTCVAQFAFPPVELKWVKLNGPDAEFIQTLPNYIESSSKTLSTSVKLIVHPENSGSLFACEARHPTFRGKTYSAYVEYGMPRPGALVQERPERPTLQLAGGPLDKNDTAMIVTICAITALVFVLGASLYKGRAGWELDARPRIQYTKVPAADVEAANGCLTGPIETDIEVIPNGNVKKHDADLDKIDKAGHSKCVLKVIIGSVLSVFLLLSLGVSIPLYLKGVTPPDLGTDMITSVVAGSALYIDCSGLATPKESVLEVTWRKDDKKFYHQSLVLDKNVGYSDNSSLGFQIGFRITSSRLGQINIWPVMPGEEGIYSCEIRLHADSHGKTNVKKLTYGVFVITGLMINTALLAVLGIACFCATFLVVLGVYHSLRCVAHHHHHIHRHHHKKTTS